MEKTYSKSEWSVLYIGIGKNASVDHPEVFDCIDFTGSGKDEDDTISWVDLTVRKTIVPKSYHRLYIVNPSLCMTQGGVIEPRRFQVFLSILKDEGDIWLCKDLGGSYLKVANILERNNFSSLLNGPLTIDKRRSDFLVYAKKVEICLPPLQLKIALPKEKNIFVPRTFLTVEFSSSEKASYVTVSFFRSCCYSEEFICEFTDSLRKLYTAKKEFYVFQLSTFEQSLKRLKSKMKSLKVRKIPDAILREKYPNYELYALNIAELEELICKIDSRTKSLSEEDIKSSLVDAIENSEHGLASLMGREEIKNMLVTKLYTFCHCHKSAYQIFHNVALLGRSGSGKTKIGKVLAYVYSKSGLLVTDNIRVVSRANLIGSYVGQTAPRTRGLLMECLEGVLFIDEAHSLVPKTEGPEGERDYGLEAISEIVNFLDKYIGMNVVIVAGYEEPMKNKFFPSNQGLNRRFPTQITLKGYTNEQLANMCIKFLEERVNDTEEINEEIANTIFSCIGCYRSQRDFSAGDMLNLGAEILSTVYVSGWEIVPNIFKKFVKEK